MTTQKTPMNFRLTDDARAILTECSARLGVTNVAVVEMAIRKFAAECGGSKNVPQSKREKS